MQKLAGGPKTKSKPYTLTRHQYGRLWFNSQSSYTIL